MELFISPLIIFFAQLVLVPMMTLRMILVVKGMKNQASLLAGVEALIYVVSLGLIFSDLENVWNMLAYAFGFGIGIFLGGWLETKLKIGYLTYQVSLPTKNEELIQTLRTAGYGVTVSQGEGIDSIRYKLDILTKRDRADELENLVLQGEERAFIVAHEPKSFKGGYLTKSMKKREHKFFKKKDS